MTDVLIALILGAFLVLAGVVVGCAITELTFRDVIEHGRHSMMLQRQLAEFQADIDMTDSAFYASLGRSSAFDELVHEASAVSPFVVQVDTANVPDEDE